MRQWSVAILFVSAASCAHLKNQFKNTPVPAEKPPQETAGTIPKRSLPLLRLTDDTDRMQMRLILLSTFQIITTARTGTCVCVRENLVLTAAHLILFDENKNPLDAGAQMAIFELQDDGIFIQEVKRVKINLIKFNPQYDLALYEIADPEMHCRPVARAKIRPNLADQYNRFGFNPTWMWTFGTYVEMTSLVVDGETHEYDIYSMPSAPGMSGGPVLTNSGELTGIAVIIIGYNHQNVDETGQPLIIQERYVGSVTYDQVNEFLKDIPRN